jgi:cell shape-determining protein MreC
MQVNSTYIRNLTEKQQKLLQDVATANKLKTASKTFLYTLEQHNELQQENERLKRIIEMIKRKSNRLEAEKLELEGIIDKIGSIVTNKKG